MNTFVLPIDSAKATLAVVGGKGANLSHLSRTGFPVPPGFLITTEAYRAFVQANNLQPQIAALVHKAQSVAEASMAIRRLFKKGRITAEVAASIQAAYAELLRANGDLSPVAVRSSATAEDLPDASFAGQQESYLNVYGEIDLLEAVQRCWSSLWTPRALEYRARQNIDPSSVSLAVVVQVMIPAEVSGILFTANPMSGVRDEIVLDAAWGLGEAIVGGMVTPDHIVIDKASGAIKQITIGDKAIMTVPTASGTEDREVEESKRHAQVLDAAQVAELTKLGAAVEKSYGVPQDIEWCLANGKFYVVQARPITTLPPDAVKWESPVDGAKWLKDIQAAEWATEPLSPLGATTTFATMIAARQREFPMQKSPWYALMNGWLYIRADLRMSRMMVFLMGWVARLLAGKLDGHQRVQQSWPHQLAILDSLEKTNLAILSDSALQSHMESLFDALGWWWWEVSYDTSVELHTELIIGMLHIPKLTNPAVLFRGNDSLLLEAERALRQASRTGEIDVYLARFGHFVESADPLHPTLRESPDLLNQHLAVARQSKVSTDERLSRMRYERTEAEKLVHIIGGLRGFFARRLLDAGQSHAAHIDDAVFHFQRVLALIRAAFLEVGKRLARAGKIERIEDVFYMERGELWAHPTDLVARVSQRCLIRERQKRLAPPPSIPSLSDPIWGRDQMMKMTTSAGVQERNGQKIIVGTSSSPGRAHGIARVITGPDDFHRFQPGDVLIAHTTTPVWTPLFGIASAAITEVGGPFSHAAIVAREFGIPLVTGAIDAVREISDGMPIVVDGSSGIVYLESLGRNEGQQANAHLGHSFSEK